MKSSVAQYFSALQKEHDTGRAREHSYRPALKSLLEAINPRIIATNEPSREKCGAPDFILIEKDIPIGYGEVKDIGIPLDEVEKSEQMERYFVLNNLFLSDYLEFRFFLNEKKYENVCIGRLVKGKLVPQEDQFERLALVLKEFALNSSITITSASQLAKMMADKAKLMKEIIFNALKDAENPKSTLHDQFAAFKKILMHDLDESGFADVYAQTIAYGLFVARFHDDTPETFSRREAQELMPHSNPFLRKLFHHIAGPDLDSRIAWIVDALADVFAHTNVEKILANFGTATKREDPVIHFYETFLSSYDAKLKKSRGVYYTPEPVVSFIVRSVDSLLKSEFGLAQGLADTSKTTITVQRQGKTKKDQMKKEEVHRVQILDPAAGTGTFLNEVIKNLYKRFEGQEGVWSSYVDTHLLPRLHGFELMMAPYTMCHLKLGLTLKETGYKEGKQRLGVYLTNSLEEGHEEYETLWGNILAQESNEASRIKNEKPIMIVLGNPPYSGISANEGIGFMDNLIADYKKEPTGGKLKEKKHWLNDDYVRFLRFSEYLVEKNHEGMVGMITNHGYLDNPTFRGMRWHLLQTFDKIYIFDLHGNTKKKEKTPDGSKDQNVFDIQQGVSIILAIKKSNSGKPANVYHADLHGLRDKKYEILWQDDVSSIKWDKVELHPPLYLFANKNWKNEEEYKKGISLPNLFMESTVGFVTGKDKVTIAFTKENLLENIDFLINRSDQEIRTHFDMKEKDARDWTIPTAKKDLLENKDNHFMQLCAYRPFDLRYTHYTGNSRGFYASPQQKIIRHILNQKNLVLCCSKQQSGSSFQHILATDRIPESSFVSNRTREIGYLFPLYLYPDEKQKGMFETLMKPNLNIETILQIKATLKMQFIEDGIGDSKKTFGPEDIFDYIYAILHSPTYRKRYKEFLKIDFPRVPFTSDAKLFWKLVSLGREIRLLHLLESPTLEKLITRYSQDGTNAVERVEFEGKEKGKVWINETQYFNNVPRIAWEFFIGGYQPAQKWLKDRKGRTLNIDDITHYQRVIISLVETDKLMKEIDEVIEKNGSFPIK